MAHTNPTTTHQTVRLARGKHTDPRSGACVMELASMLGGEPFSDRPECVCPVIGGFLRAYNDTVDEGRRQDLYVYASAVVGTWATERVERARAQHLVRWAKSIQQRRWLGRWISPRLDRRLGSDSHGEFAVRCMPRPIADEEHRLVLALIDELIAIGSPREPGATHPASTRLDSLIAGTARTLPRQRAAT